MKVHTLHILTGRVVAIVLSSCGIDRLTTEDSPDKSKTAMAYVYRIGDSNTYVSIRCSHNRKWMKVLKLEGTVPVSFKWINDKELDVYILHRMLIRDMNTAVDEIKINIIEEKASGPIEQMKEPILTGQYYASKQRLAQIKENYTKVQIGMTPQQVKQILGEPDELKPLYEPKIYKPKQIGYTQWYLIQLKTDKGSENDRDEKLVRISYDLTWIVTRIDRWGFD